MSILAIARSTSLSLGAALALFAAAASAQQRPAAPAAAAPTLPPLFFKEEWRQRTAPPNAAPTSFRKAA